MVVSLSPSLSLLCFSLSLCLSVSLSLCLSLSLSLSLLDVLFFIPSCDLEEDPKNGCAPQGSQRVYSQRVEREVLGSTESSIRLPVVKLGSLWKAGQFVVRSQQFFSRGLFFWACQC